MTTEIFSMSESEFVDNEGLGITESQFNYSRRRLSNEEFKRRRADRQRKYREQQKIDREHLQRQIVEVQHSIDETQRENFHLSTSNDILSRIVDVCSSAVQSVHSAADRAFNCTLAQPALNIGAELAMFYIQKYDTSDAQLEYVVRSGNLALFNRVSYKLMDKIGTLVGRWDDTDDPAVKSQIEKDIEKIQNNRIRAQAMMAKFRPDDVVKLCRSRLAPLDPDGGPNEKIRQAARLLEFTPKQLESLERQWKLYLQETEDTRQECRSLLQRLASLSPTQSSEDPALLTSMAAAGGYLQLLSGTVDLGQYPHREVSSFFKVAAWFHQNLTLVQLLKANHQCRPYFLDLIQLCFVLFENNQKPQYCVESVSA